MVLGGMRNDILRIRFSWIVIFALGLMGCSRDERAIRDRPLVVCTTTIVADLVREIAGDRVDLYGLMEPGVDPHSYIPRIGDSRMLEHADLIVFHGLHLEGKLQRTLEEMSIRGRKVIALAETIDPARLISAGEHFPGTKDPHIWGDVELWEEVITPTVAALMEIDPESSHDFHERAENYRKELRTLHAWVRETVDSIPEKNRVLVTSHDAFRYFGRSYGMEVRALQGVATSSEAGLGDRRDLVEYLKKHGIPAVFTESTVNPKAIITVANEAGISYSRSPLYSDALGKSGDCFMYDGQSYDRGTYLGMMRHNAIVMHDDLSAGDPSRE